MPAGCNCGPNSPLARALGCYCLRRGTAVSCHFRGCKAPLSVIVSGAISSELALPLLQPTRSVCVSLSAFSLTNQQSIVGKVCGRSECGENGDNKRKKKTRNIGGLYEMSLEETDCERFTQRRAGQVDYIEMIFKEIHVAKVTQVAER